MTLPVKQSVKQSALVLFSAGQDSTTCLAWALSRYDQVETIGFDYGQRHAIEMQFRPVVLEALRQQFPQWAHKLGTDHHIDLPVLGRISDTALTSDAAIRLADTGLPNTFVPGRNLLFLTIAAAVAYRRHIPVLVTGVCETDFSGYPDCRNETMRSLEQTLNLGMEAQFDLQTPLMWIDKAQTWRMAHELGGQPLLNLVLEYTHTCYLGNHHDRHVWGYGCGTCPACQLRASGYARFTASA